MIIGTQDPSSLRRSVLIFDPENNAYSSGPSLINQRQWAACTIFYSPMHNNRPVIMAAGGRSQRTAEVFDYTKNDKWEQIGSLPSTYTSSFLGARAIPSPSGKGAYLQHWSLLYKLVCTSQSCDWNLIQQSLGTSVYNAVMMHLPPGYTC